MMEVEKERRAMAMRGLGRSSRRGAQGSTPIGSARRWRTLGISRCLRGALPVHRTEWD